jgi:glycine/D-amino acid oxidase-like deaminating enzyme
VIQRKADGNIVLGTSRNHPGLSEQTKREIQGKDDRVHSVEIERDAVRAFRQAFVDRGEEVHGEGLSHAWSGIIGMTADSVPFVGEVPSLPGQFVCAGFNGHGIRLLFFLPYSVQHSAGHTQEWHAYSPAHQAVQSS